MRNQVLTFLFLLFSSAQLLAQYKFIAGDDTLNAFDIVRKGKFFYYYSTQEDFNNEKNQKYLHINEFDKIISIDKQVYLSNDELNYFLEKSNEKDTLILFPNSVGINLGRFMQFSDVTFFYEKWISPKKTLRAELSRSRYLSRSMYGFEHQNKAELQITGQHYFLTKRKFSPFVSAGVGFGRYMIYRRIQGYYSSNSETYFEYNRWGASFLGSAGIAFWLNTFKIDLAIGYRYRSYFRANKRYDKPFVPFQLSIAYNF